MRSGVLVILIFLCDIYLFGQKQDDITLKNEFSLGALLGSWEVQGASFLFRRMGTVSFRARLDAEIVSENNKYRNDYVVFRLGADQSWIRNKWQAGAGVDVFGTWIEYLSDSIATNNYQIGLMPFLRISYAVDSHFSIGFEGGPKFGYFLTSSELKSGWQTEAFQGLVLLIGYRF